MLPKMILNYEAFPEQAPYLPWHWSSQDTFSRKYHTTFIYPKGHAELNKKNEQR